MITTSLSSASATEYLIPTAKLDHIPNLAGVRSKMQVDCPNAYNKFIAALI